MATEFSRVTYKLMSLSLNENNLFLPANRVSEGCVNSNAQFIGKNSFLSQ